MSAGADVEIAAPIMNRSEPAGDQIFDNEIDGVKVSEIKTRPGNSGTVPSRPLGVELQFARRPAEAVTDSGSLAGNESRSSVVSRSTER